MRLEMFARKKVVWTENARLDILPNWRPEEIFRRSVVALLNFLIRFLVDVCMFSFCSSKSCFIAARAYGYSHPFCSTFFNMDVSMPNSFAFFFIVSTSSSETSFSRVNNHKPPWFRTLSALSVVHKPSETSIVGWPPEMMAQSSSAQRSNSHRTRLLEQISDPP